MKVLLVFKVSVSSSPEAGLGRKEGWLWIPGNNVIGASRMREHWQWTF